MREQPQHGAERLGILRRERRLDLRRERRRPEPEVPVALRREPLAEPRRGFLRAPVLGEPPRKLLRRLFGIELRELGVLVGEERARLQLEQRGDQHEELAARLEVELFALGQPLEERDDDAGEVDVPQVELLLEDERKQQVERPLEGVEIKRELADDHARERTVATGRGPSGQPSSGRSRSSAASPSARASSRTRPTLRGRTATR